MGVKGLIGWCICYVCDWTLQLDRLHVRPVLFAQCMSFVWTAIKITELISSSKSHCLSCYLLVSLAYWYFCHRFPHTFT